jgi:hypothetical protein
LIIRSWIFLGVISSFVKNLITALFSIWSIST